MKIIVRAKPNSKEEKIEKVNDTEFVVFVKKPPVRDLANKAIIHALANYFGVAHFRICIISGHTSKQKVVEVS